MQTYQEIILKLQEYWNRHGCALLQPYDMEVGAGTFHTGNFPSRYWPGALAGCLRTTFTPTQRQPIR